MFSKAKIEKTKSEEGYIVYSDYHNLPDNRVLYLSSDKERKVTTLKIFSVDDLTKSLVERTLPTEIKGEYNLVCLLPNGTILLEMFGYARQGTFLLKICPKTLDILSKQVWSTFYTVGVLSDEQFFAIDKANGLYGADFDLTIYQWDTDAYKKISATKLDYRAKAGEGLSVSNIESLGNNQFCCHFRGHNNHSFNVLLFQIDPKTLAIEEIGLIQPKTGTSSGSGASGTIVALPNDKLLTYHYVGENAQIWDTNTRTCIKEWDWNTITKSNNITRNGMTIMPFPDSKHLLVTGYTTLYIFNTNTLRLQEINLEGEFNSFSKETFKSSICARHLILPNGKVLAFVDSNRPDCNQILFDLDEMVNYRENKKMYKDSQLLAGLFFNRQEFPSEIEATFVTEEKDETNQHASCALM